MTQFQDSLAHQNRGAQDPRFLHPSIVFHHQAASARIRPRPLRPGGECFVPSEWMSCKPRTPILPPIGTGTSASRTQVNHPECSSICRNTWMVWASFNNQGGYLAPVSKVVSKGFLKGPRTLKKRAASWMGGRCHKGQCTWKDQ